MQKQICKGFPCDLYSKNAAEGDSGRYRRLIVKAQRRMIDDWADEKFQPTKLCVKQRSEKSMRRRANAALASVGRRNSSAMTTSKAH
jgi:hypothetical protein